MLYTKMLVPIDGSRGSWKAFRKALVIAKEMEAEVKVLSVEEHLPRYAATVDEVDEEKQQEDDFFADLHRQVMTFAEEQGRRVEVEVVPGHAAERIVHYAGEGGFDVIVIGHTGHSGVWGSLLGSTTSRVVDHAPCDVLVVR